MKHSLPILGILLLAGVALVCKGVFTPQQGLAAPDSAPAKTAATAAPPVAPLRVAEGVQPLEVLKAAYDKVDHYGSVSAKLRQRADLFGVSMLGTGTYIQGSSPSHRLRYEVTMQLGNRKASVQQIADGEYLWTRRELASAPTLTRVNIDRVLEIQEAHRAQAALRSGYVLGLGGLPRVLLSLQTCWTFDTVAETTHGGMPMYVLRGVWNRDALAHLLQDQKEAIRKGAPADITKLGEQVPDEVLVFLGRDDLFPYRLEYRRTPAAQVAGQGSPPALKVLLATEFYEVQINESIDPTLFTFDPGELNFDDETNLYVYRFEVWPK